MKSRVPQTLKRLLSTMPRLDLVYRICHRYANFYEGKNGYEQHLNGELRFLQRTVKAIRPAVVFDVGANTGEWTQALLALQPDAQVHCFEPASETCRKLRARGFDSNVIVNEFGLSSKKESRPFYYRADNDLISSLYLADRGEQKLDPESRRSVELETGDSYCERRGIERVHYCKIDVEGHDFEVLQGLHGMLSRGAIDVLQFEYGPYNIASRALMCDVLEYTSQFEYDVFRILARGVLPIPEYTPQLDDFKLCNYVMVKKSLSQSIA